MNGGFDGLVTTDWWTFWRTLPRDKKQENDIKMAAGYPGTHKKEAYEKRGLLLKQKIRLSAKKNPEYDSEKLTDEYH